MKLKRKKIGDRSYNLVDVETGEVVATASQTGEHGRDNYPWEWSLNDGRIFGRLDIRTGHSVESLRDAVDIVETGAREYGLLSPAGTVEANEIKEGQVFRAMIRGTNYFFRATQDAYFAGNEEATITANNAKGELMDVKLLFREEVSLYLPEREARRAKALAEAKAEKVETALAAMVRKLDARNKRNSRGYVTKRDELVRILSEVSKNVSVVIVEKEQRGYGHKEIEVEIKLSLTLERELL